MLEKLSKITAIPHLGLVMDFRADAPSTPKGAWPLMRRTAADLQGVILHNTGHHGQRTSEGWLDQIGTNFFIMKSGVIYYCYDVLEQRPGVRRQRFREYSRTCVAVEFIGNFQRTNGTYEGGVHRNHHDTPSAAQIHSGRRLLRFLRTTYGISLVYAHRQIDGTRRGDDPGKHIWYNVGEWGIQKLGLRRGAESVADNPRTRRDESAPYRLPASWSDPANELVAF